MSKEELNNILKLNDRIQSKLRQKEELRATMTGVSGIDYSKDRVQTSPTNSIEELVIKIVDFEEEITRDIDKLVDMKREAYNSINKVEGIYGIILEMRY